MSVPPISSITALPEVHHITLLLKHHKSTTLLSVSPTQPFTEIKALLLAALSSRNVTSLPNSHGTLTPLPSKPEDIEFGVLADKKDPSKGWRSTESLELDGEGGGKGKKKITPGRARADAGNTPEGVGLGDGSLVAYRIRSTGKEQARGREMDAEDEDDDAVIDIDMEEDPGWDVVLPSFEDEEREQAGVEGTDSSEGP